jgi:hypothetical protein
VSSPPRRSDPDARQIRNARLIEERLGAAVHELESAEQLLWELGGSLPEEFLLGYDEIEDAKQAVAELCRTTTGSNGGRRG